MSGKREAERWRQALTTIEKVENELGGMPREDMRPADRLNVEVSVYMASLSEDQVDLWRRLLSISQYGQLEWTRSVFDASGATLKDLLVLLYVTDQLVHHSGVSTPEYEAFFALLMQLINSYKSPQLDVIICKCLESKFKSIESHLMKLFFDHDLTRKFLAEYAEKVNDGKNRNPEEVVQIVQVVSETVGRILADKIKLRPDEAAKYLSILVKGGLSLDARALDLLAVIYDYNVIARHLYLVTGKIKSKEFREDQVTGEQGILALLISKLGVLDPMGLRDFINDKEIGCYFEKLFALSLQKNLEGIHEDVLYELMVDGDVRLKDDEVQRRLLIRKKILKKPEFRETFRRLDLLRRG